MTTNSGVKLWNQAKRIIPGGNQLLSKRAEMFLPDEWPSYYKKAKGIQVWDLDDRVYTDMSIMGIGSCVLGYAHDEVNRAVKKAVDGGSMCTLNCHEEVELAEKLIELHPWAQMVRFARTGGEACAIAIRIARAASGKDKIAFCGYHGWTDWYLSANLADSHNLDGQLLPGLQPLGVPRALKHSAFPFEYGNLASFQEVVERNKGEIGVVIMEVQREKEMDLEFLKTVQSTVRKIGAVLIYDEVTSGFRMRAGGLHVLYGLEPEIVVLGKALGNGFPISAVVGKEKVMQAAQETFISSTYWSERIGFAAGLEVIRQFESKGVAQHLIEMGTLFRKGLEEIFAKKGLHIEIGGLASIPILVIKEEKPLVVKTILTQEMLKRGILASNLFFASFAHSEKDVHEYLQIANEVFETIGVALRSGKLEKLLEVPVCHSGFSRLN